MKDTRQEHYDRALASWRKIYQQTDGNPAVWEATWALEALASLAYARTVTTPTLSPGQVQAMADDAATFDQFLQAMAKRGQKPAETVLTSRLKLSMAQAHPMDAAFLAQLKNLAYASDDMAAGEALFLLGQPAEANHHFEALDGQNAEGFLGLGDRLLLLGALDMAGAMYHRGLELAPTQDDPMDTVGQLKEGLARIEAKRQLAASWIKTGDGLFQAKKYNQALSQYQRASQLYPEWLTPYLRQGDTYERLKQKAAAAKAFGQAVHLNPDLLQSTAFAKRYRRLQKV
jgi:tetratricopeptide (TPR) repeat protein